MKRKIARKSPPAPKPDTIEFMVVANAQALSLKLDPSWKAGVTFNLHLILHHAALVDEFPLPDDAEPAAIFHA